MIPVCYSKAQSVSSSSSQMPQNLITCIYQMQLCNSPTYLTLTWSKTLFSHTLTISAAPEYCFSVTISLHPTTFSFFRARPGSKSVSLSTQHHQDQKVKLYWDFTKAKFTQNSSEPESCFYVAITCNGKLEFLLGDMLNEFYKRAGPSTRTCLLDHQSSLLSRREHVFGGKSYVSRAQFMGCMHEIVIECVGGTLKVKVDGEIRLIVKRLAWKFRGNERILVGGIEVEFYWDVFNWLSKDVTQHRTENDHGRGRDRGLGVFVFQVGDGGVWPEMIGAEKKLMRKSLSTSAVGAAGGAATPSECVSPAPSWTSVLQWAEESSDCGRTSSCSSTRSCNGSNGGFSLLLYAWRN